MSDESSHLRFPLKRLAFVRFFARALARPFTLSVFHNSDGCRFVYFAHFPIVLFCPLKPTLYVVI